jgi:hypothetical protein
MLVVAWMKIMDAILLRSNVALSEHISSYNSSARSVPWYLYRLVFSQRYGFYRCEAV